jgi:hypothetical protein
MRYKMDVNTEWIQVKIHDVLVSEYACERDGKKAFVKMLSTQRWVACILGHRLYLTKHFRQRIEAQDWADQQLKSIPIK